MMTISRAAPVAALTTLLALAACGTTTTEYVTVTAPASTYLVEYLPGMMDAVVGKYSFKLRVRTRADSLPAAALAITLKPLMTMPTMSHGAPADLVTESATPGTYDCAVYYQMASGAGMGYWELAVKIGTETTTFYPAVAMAMGTDTTKTPPIWGPSDTAMGGMSMTKYNIFRDGPVTAAAGSLPLYLVRAENMMLDFKPVYVGAALAGTTVTAVSLTASTDGGATYPITATHVAHGHWTMPLSGLTAGTQATIQLKLSVNGENKTTDGNVLTTTLVSFKLTPQ